MVGNGSVGGWVGCMGLGERVKHSVNVLFNTKITISMFHLTFNHDLNKFETFYAGLWVFSHLRWEKPVFPKAVFTRILPQYLPSCPKPSNPGYSTM